MKQGSAFIGMEDGRVKVLRARHKTHKENHCGILKQLNILRTFQQLKVHMPHDELQKPQRTTIIIILRRGIDKRRQLLTIITNFHYPMWHSSFWFIYFTICTQLGFSSRKPTYYMHCLCLCLIRLPWPSRNMISNLQPGNYAPSFTIAHPAKFKQLHYDGYCNMFILFIFRLR